MQRNEIFILNRAKKIESAREVKMSRETQGCTFEPSIQPLKLYSRPPPRPQSRNIYGHASQRSNQQQAPHLDYFTLGPVLYEESNFMLPSSDPKQSLPPRSRSALKQPKIYANPRSLSRGSHTSNKKRDDDACSSYSHGSRQSSYSRIYQQKKLLQKQSAMEERRSQSHGSLRGTVESQAKDSRIYY